MTTETDNEPVLLIIDKDEYIIAAGDPKHFKLSEIGKYIKTGCSAKTVTLKEYRESELKWIYDKPK